MIEVYHHDYSGSLTFLRDDELRVEVGKMLLKKAYKKVAVVNTAEKNSAYMLTNHIDKAWQQNDNVTAFDWKARSTSIGDIMVEEGNISIVASTGFIPLVYCYIPSVQTGV